MMKAIAIAALALAPHAGLAADMRTAKSMRGAKAAVAECTASACPPGALKEEVAGDADAYCKNREKKGTHRGGNLWLFCGCSIKKGFIKPGEDGDDPAERCMKPNEPDSKRKDCTWSETASTANPDGVATFCVPKDPGSAPVAAGAETAGAETAGAETAGAETADNSAALAAEEAAAAEAAAIVPGSAADPAAPKAECGEAQLNKMDECGTLTGSSSEECTKAYSACKPAMAKAVAEGIPRVGCTVKGFMPCGTGLFNRPDKIEWTDGKTYCCHKEQPGEENCEVEKTPPHEGWPKCCVAHEEAGSCSDYYYNGHPKLDYYHTSHVNGMPINNVYCCPDDLSIDKQLQEEAAARKEEAAAAAAAAEAAAAAAQKAKAEEEKRIAEKAAKEAARKAAEEEAKAARAEKVAKEAEEQRKLAEKKALAEQARLLAAKKAQEEKDEAKQKKDLADAEIARKKAEQLAIEEEKIRKEKEAWQTKLDAMHTDDENYQKRGCRESGVSVINALVSFFSTLGEPPKEGEHPGCEEKDGFADVPVPETGIARVDERDSTKPEKPGKSWCCENPDWRKQCIGKCKKQGHTTPGNPCFTRCRVNNLYEFSPEAAAVDPESHKAGTEGGAVAGATEAAEGAGDAGAEATGRR
jgi:hypothetical protein